MTPHFVDLHCHPDLKPYGKSFKHAPGEHSPDPDNETSIWHRKAPGVFGGLLQMLTGVAKFTQSDFESVTGGRFRLVCASLYPIERAFFRNQVGHGIVSDAVDSFIAGVGKARVDFVQNITDYFADLEMEYDYYKQMDDTTVSLNGQEFKYKLVASYSEMLQMIAASADADNILFVAITIEGMHALNSHVAAAQPDEGSFLHNVDKLKAWPHTPCFVTFCHHFENRLCGHAKSLFGFPVDDTTNQEDGVNEGFSELGVRVLDRLLDNTKGKRILIDIKHMSSVGRNHYFQMLGYKNANKPIPLLFQGIGLKYREQAVPVVVSHGAANGRRSFEAMDIIDGELGHTFFEKDINFYDDEIVIIARSGGIFGLQLDEHRLANGDMIESIPHSLYLDSIRHARSELLWNQVQHIAELLDKHGLPAWDCIALGTDSDGIVNPINGFLTLDTMPDLYDYVWDYAEAYMNGRGHLVLGSYNLLSVSDIMNKVFHLNAKAFLQRWFV